MNLHENPQEFYDTLLVLGDRLNTSPSIIEKDYLRKHKGIAPTAFAVGVFRWGIHGFLEADGIFREPIEFFVEACYNGVVIHFFIFHAYMGGNDDEENGTNELCRAPVGGGAVLGALACVLCGL